MKISKKLLLTGVVSTVAAGSMLGLGFAGASSSTSNPRASLIDKIATKFNLNKSDVQQVFEEQHTEMQENMKAKRSEHLQSLVDSGKITAAQKTAIESKMDEHRAKMDALRDQDLTEDERHTQMEQLRTDLESWAKDQGIDLSAIRPQGGPRGHGFGGRHGMMHDSENESSSSTN